MTCELAVGAAAHVVGGEFEHTVADARHALWQRANSLVGVTLSLYAIQHTQTGIASSIMATAPLLIIPMTAMVHKERITARSVLGTAVGLLGVVLLFL